MLATGAAQEGAGGVSRSSMRSDMSGSVSSKMHKKRWDLNSLKVVVAEVSLSGQMEG